MVTQFINPRKAKWYSATELSGQFNRLGKQIDRLMLLEYVWKQVVGERSRFWTLTAVQRGTLFVKVKIAVAKNELTGRRRELIKELNKHFETPWIKHIEIQ